MNDTYMVRDNCDLRRYYMMIPNIIDDLDLSVYAYRLYGHLKRVAGEEGQCWQSSETLAKACGMGEATVSRAKMELVDKGLITIELVKNPKGGKDYHNITITDVWEINVSKYTTSPQEVTSSHQEVTTSHQELATSHQEVTTSHQEIKNNPIKNNPIKNNPINDSHPPLSIGQTYFLQQFRAKRFKFPIQEEKIFELERVYGIDILREGIDWAATQGMTMGHAINALKTALPKWGQKKPNRNGSKSGVPEPAGFVGIRAWIEDQEDLYAE